MTMKTVKLALAAAAVLGAGAAAAQEMGAAPTDSTPATTTADAQQNESVVDTPLTVNEIVSKDDGEKIVEEAQQTPPAEVSPKNASDAMVKWVTDNGYAEGFNDERGYFLQIGVARDNSLDPLDEDFMTKREMLYREAQLRAKVNISGLVDREISGSNWKNGLSADDVKKFEAKYAREINEMNEMKRKVANLMLALEAAETECLKGVTATDRLNALVDKVIKKLDRSYDAGHIVAEKKARYDAIKAAYDDAKTAADELEQKKIDMFPSQTMNARVDSAVRIKLHGAIPLHQIESCPRGDEGCHREIGIVGGDGEPGEPFEVTVLLHEFDEFALLYQCETTVCGIEHTLRVFSFRTAFRCFLLDLYPFVHIGTEDTAFRLEYPSLRLIHRVDLDFVIE